MQQVGATKWSGITILLHWLVAGLLVLLSAMCLAEGRRRTMVFAIRSSSRRHAPIVDRG